MQIAVLISGILPVPTIQGGVGNSLTNFYLDYKNKYHLHIIIYSNHHAINAYVRDFFKAVENEN